jgi:hypothetical protein
MTKVGPRNRYFPPRAGPDRGQAGGRKNLKNPVDFRLAKPVPAST